MFVDRGFHLLARNILAAADDDVLLAIDDEQIPARIDIADVAGQEVPVGGERRLGRIGASVIFGEVAHRPNRHFAAFALRDRLARSVEDREIDQRCRGAPGRIGLVDIIVAEIAAADAVGLGQAIAEQGLGPAHFLGDAADMVDRARRAARGEIGHGRQIIVAALGVGQDFEAHQRHADEVTDLLGLD